MAYRCTKAAHQLLDKPLIFNDPVAVDLVPESSECAIFSAVDKYHEQEVLLRSLFALRSRFAEDCLAAAVARGVSQYVIVGAGLDTFPWRQPEFAATMQIYMVDHVTALAWTQVRYRERGLSKPVNLVLFPWIWKNYCLVSA